MEKQANIHAGHRQRVKKLFLKTGGFYMEDHQLLELALFYSVPRKDTNPLAHQLLNEFGSLSGVIEAAPEALMAVKGVSTNTAALLKLIGEIASRHRRGLQSPAEKLGSPEELEQCLRRLLHGEKHIFIVSMDAAGRVLCADSMGGLGSSSPHLDLKGIVVEAARTQASQVALGVPRPGAVQLPTQTDLEEALRCERALAALSVRLRDVLYFSGDECVSLRRMRLLH